MPCGLTWVSSAPAARANAPRPRLIGDIILQFLWRDDRSGGDRTRAGRVGKRARDVGANLLRQSDDTAHDRRVATVEPGRDIRGRHQRQDAGIVTHVQRPNPSPMSQLMLIWVTMIFHPHHLDDRRLTEQCFSCQPDLFGLAGMTARKCTISPGLPWPTTPISLLMTVAILA